MLALLRKQPRVRVVALRHLSTESIMDSEVQSIVFDVDCEAVIASFASCSAIEDAFTVAGWSLNAKGNAAPDIVSLR